MVGGELVISWEYVCTEQREGTGGGLEEGVCSLILKENVEEINLNYKDEASLESGSGKDYTGKGSTGNRHYGSWVFFFPACFCFSFILILWGWGWGGALPTLFDLPPKCSLSPSFTGRPLRQGSPCRDRWILALLPGLACHRQQMSRFLREHPFRVTSQTNKN